MHNVYSGCRWHQTGSSPDTNVERKEMRDRLSNCRMFAVLLVMLFMFSMSSVCDVFQLFYFRVAVNMTIKRLLFLARFA